MKKIKLLPTLLATLTLCGLTGCASQAQAPSPPPLQPTAAPALPPRPMSLPLANTKPCDLLTATQVKQLKTTYLEPGFNGDGQGSPDCLWSNGSGPPDMGWVVRFDLKHDASYYLGPEGSQVVQVAGFPAVQSTAMGQDPNTHCILMVDVAPGQGMYVLFSNLQGDYPGINHQVACQLADQVATMAVGNLRRLVG